MLHVSGSEAFVLCTSPVSLKHIYLQLSIISNIAYDSPIADAIADSGIYDGDASGGRFSSHGPLIRCGVGLVKIGYNTKGNTFRKWGVQMNLPGSVQTVPRAELYALQHLLNEATEHANIEFITDNKTNCDTFNKGIFAGTKSVNHDLFKHICRCIAENNCL